MEKRNPPGLPAPIGQYSQLAVTEPGDRVVYVAGQLPFDGAGELVGAGDFAAQARFVFGGLIDLLDAAGSSLDLVVQLRIFMTEPEHYPLFKQVRAEVYAGNGVTVPPPATTLTVRSLVGGALVELDAVAVVGPPGR